MRASRWLFCSTLVWALLSDALAADEVVETAVLQLRFNPQGSLVEAAACFPQCNHPEARKLALHESQGLIEFVGEESQTWVQRRGLSGDVHQLHFSDRTGRIITWTIPEVGYQLEVAVTGSDQMILRAGDGFRARPAAGFGGWLEQVRYVGISSSGVSQVALDDTDITQLASEWAGFRNRFWTLMASAEAEGGYAVQTADENHQVVLQHAHGQPEMNYAFYLGPVEPRELQAVDEILGGMMYAGLWFWLRWICFSLFYLLGLVQSVVPVWGCAIMLLSLAVHIIMLPLSRVADRLQQQVNKTEARLAPHLALIKREFKGEIQAAKIIALYKTERVHPLYSLKSLLGVAVVIPVFIGAFDMMAENIHLLNAGFLWIGDLSRPDALFTLPFSLPFFGADLNLLPLLMTALSVIASSLHRPVALDPASRSRQVRNMLLLAFAFLILFYTFPAGMVLYWTTNNLISVSKSLWKRRKPMTERANS